MQDKTSRRERRISLNQGTVKASPCKKQTTWLLIFLELPKHDRLLVHHPKEYILVDCGKGTLFRRLGSHFFS